ncbi:MAG TPA: MBL fold metallo-hydrolase [Myxococcaceae bacterium]|nr:MBL fold metallo-hydrolase [Myxococcaceae bacterium]
MKELLPDVFTWSWLSPRHGYNFNGYLVRLPLGNVCIDPAEMPDEVLDELARQGVTSILLTNRNHVRATEKVRSKTGAPVFIHPADAPEAERLGATIDDYLEVGQSIGPLIVHPASGKSPGEVCLFWPERKTLFMGDACIGNPPGQCSLLPDKVMEDPLALRRYLRRIASELEFDALLLGDGAPILQGGRQALATLVATFH